MERNGRLFQEKRYANPPGLTWVGKARQHLSAGLFPPKGGREILWLNDPTFLAPIDVHAVVVVEDVLSAIPTYLQQDYTLAIAPLAIGGGRGAVMQHATGVRICLLEMPHVLRLPGVALLA